MTLGSGGCETGIEIHNTTHRGDPWCLTMVRATTMIRKLIPLASYPSIKAIPAATLIVLKVFWDNRRWIHVVLMRRDWTRFPCLTLYCLAPDTHPTRWKHIHSIHECCRLWARRSTTWKITNRANLASLRDFSRYWPSILCLSQVPLGSRCQLGMIEELGEDRAAFPGHVRIIETCHDCSALNQYRPSHRRLRS
jgi:hypothetical protein